MKNDGFSLIELLVAMTIMLFLLVMTTYTFQRITHRAKDSSAGISTRGDNINSIELMRLDLEHAGYGIADLKADGTENDIQPITWDSANNILLIASTLKNTKADTIGFATAIYDGSWNDIQIEERKTPTASKTLWLNTKRQFMEAPPGISAVTGNPPIIDDIYIGYPYDYTPAGASQPYSPIQYRMSTAYEPKAGCDQDTRTLIRAVDDNAVNSAGGSTIFNCIAGLTTEFAWDTVGDGKISDTELHYTAPLPAGTGSTIKIRDRLKYSMVYILSQVGKIDLTYEFTGYEAVTGKNITFKIDGESITFATEFSFDDADELKRFKQYHWKVLKITAPFAGR